MGFLLYAVLSFMSNATIGLILLDYHRFNNVWKAFVFMGLVAAGYLLVTFLIEIMEEDILAILPIFTVFPFLLSLFFRKKSNR